MSEVNLKSFDDILRHYILKPDTFWPDNTVFHRRNREKLVKARAQIKELDDDTLQARLKEDLDKRYEEKKKLYMLSAVVLLVATFWEKWFRQSGVSI